MSSKNSLRSMILSAMLLALALLLPFLTGQIPEIGGMLCPMHFPVLLCGFFCGPWYGALVGAIAPVMRFALFGMPPLMPTGTAMAFELAVYGAVAGILYLKLPKKKQSVYTALIAAMICGRLMWGTVMAVMQGIGKTSFGWSAFLAGAVLNAVPGIIVQIAIIPVIVLLLSKYSIKD